jgi:Ca2+-binding RTX toxin-like protein
VDGAHIYWANNQSNQVGESQTIGRANLDGSDVNQNFIPGANTPAGVAVGPADIFWSNTAPLAGSIGHASINGGDVSQSLRCITAGLPIPVFPALPSGLAVQGSFVYWANFGSTTIGRANLDGTGAQGSFIAASTTVSSNVDVAADALVATCAGTEATIVGTGRPDELSATNGDDVIAAGNGDDTGAAGGGTDLVRGGGGGDRVSGGAGGDTVSGGAGGDTVSGGAGSDTINARDGNADRINCGAGTDTVRLDPGTIIGASATNPAGSCESVGGVG